MEVLIRPFRPADWDGVFLLDQACFVPPYRLEYPRLRALVEDPTVAVIVVEAREEIPVEVAKPSAPSAAPETPGEIEAEANLSANPDPPTASEDTVISANAPVAEPAGVESTINTAIVGGLLLKWDAESARLVILSVMVEPGFRRVGLGRRLIGWAERIAQGRRLPELLAPLEAENGDGMAFLGAMGFAREPGMPPFFDDPAGGDLWRRGVVLSPEAPRPVESGAGSATSPPEEPR